MEYTEYTTFGKTKLVPLKIVLGKYASPGEGYEDTLWVERGEDWYAMLSPQYNNKRVRIIERDVWLRSKTIKEINAS